MGLARHWARGRTWRWGGNEAAVTAAGGIYGCCCHGRGAREVRSGGRSGGLGRAAHYLPSVNLRSPGSAYFRVAEPEPRRDGAQRVGEQEPGEPGRRSREPGGVGCPAWRQAAAEPDVTGSASTVDGGAAPPAWPLRTADATVGLGLDSGADARLVLGRYGTAQQPMKPNWSTEVS